MDGTTEPQEQTTETQTVIEPTAVAPAAEDFTGLDDAELADRVNELITEAEGIAADADTFEPELFDAALSRVTAAQAEMSARETKRASLAAARQRAAALGAQRPEKPARVPSVAQIDSKLPVVPEQTRGRFSLIVPSSAAHLMPGRKNAGDQFDDFGQIGHVLDRQMDGMVSQGKNTRSADFNLMEIRREQPAFAVGNDNPMADLAVIDQARDQKRLPGGSLMQQWEASMKRAAGGNDRRVSLTAAAGWCAPSETYYDLCEMESLAGLIDLPTATATRGGVRWTQNPTYAELDAATAYTHLTEAQVIAATAKNCSPITCPPFTDTRLDISSTCLTGSFLQLRGYPELVARWVRGELVVHAHKRNEDIIAALVARAGAVTPVVAPAADSVISAVLSAVELAAVDMRYRNRWSFSQTIEVVLPYWILALMRADYTRRNGGDPGLSDSMLMDWFAVRNVRPQFVYDWQDGYSGAGATFPGGDGTAPFSPLLVPVGTAVEFLAFPAGGVVLLEQDVITLRNVYDSTNLAQNLYTELFFEEGWAPIYPCAEIRRYSALTCPSGVTGALTDLDCTV